MSNKKLDLNRTKKVYPFITRTPRLFNFYEGEIKYTKGNYQETPASVALGSVHTVNDSGITRIYNGTEWSDYLAQAGYLQVPEISGWSFTPESHFSSEISNVDGYARFSVSSSIDESPYLLGYRPEPGEIYEIETVIRKQIWGGASNHSFYLSGFYNSGNGKAIYMYLYMHLHTNQLMIVQRDKTFGTEIHSNAISLNYTASSREFIFTKIRRSANNLLFYFSEDRQNWTLVHNENIGTFINPNSVISPGFSLSATENGEASCDLLSWKVSIFS